jgi:hypothetical protein
VKLQKVKSQLRGTDLPPHRVRKEEGWIEYSVSLGAKPHVSPDLFPRGPVIRSELTSFIILTCDAMSPRVLKPLEPIKQHPYRRVLLQSDILMPVECPW